MGAGSGAESAVEDPRGLTESTMASTLTRESQGELTPGDALSMLREGNARFVAGKPARRDLASQVAATDQGQYPFAVVLGCVDSRVPPEIVFDQGIGDIISVRVAGNVLSRDVLGSLEFACKVAGASALVVLGHTACGAVHGAINGAELGHLTGLVQKIEPAIASVPGPRDPNNADYVGQVAEANVGLVLEQIRELSPVLAGMEAAEDIMMVGAMYDVSNGIVRFA